MLEKHWTSMLHKDSKSWAFKVLDDYRWLPSSAFFFFFPGRTSTINRWSESVPLLKVRCILLLYLEIIYLFILCCSERMRKMRKPDFSWIRGYSPSTVLAFFSLRPFFFCCATHEKRRRAKVAGKIHPPQFTAFYSPFVWNTAKSAEHYRPPSLPSIENLFSPLRTICLESQRIREKSSPVSPSSAATSASPRNVGRSVRNLVQS